MAKSQTHIKSRMMSENPPEAPQTYNEIAPKGEGEDLDLRKLRPQAGSERGSAGVMISKYYKGQVPPPEVLERLERLSPGATDRMITIAEKLAQANINGPAEARLYQQRDVRRSQYLGAALVALCVILGFLSACLKFDKAIVISFLSAPLIGAVGLVVNSWRTPPKHHQSPPKPES